MPRTAKKTVEDGNVIRFTTLKVRLYPTPEQAELFEKTFGCCRYIWNQMLADQQRFYSETGAFFIPTPAKYKNGAPFLKEVDNQALIQEHNKLNQAFRVFFKDPENFGYPKFKRKKDDRDSFTACNHAFESGPTIYITKDGIRMTKAGIVKAKFSRRPQAWWKLKRITVDKTRTGKYYCSILYEHTEKGPVPVVPTEETTVGLKYSMQHFYADSEGSMADPPPVAEAGSGEAGENPAEPEPDAARFQKLSGGCSEVLSDSRAHRQSAPRLHSQGVQPDSQRLGRRVRENGRVERA